MSIETHDSGGYGKLRSMTSGGVTASLQSIGTTRTIKDGAKENLQNFQEKAKDLLKQHQRRASSNFPLPVYFELSTNMNSAIVEYSPGGYNSTKAEEMLNESLLPFCCNDRHGCKIQSQQFQVVSMKRLENHDLFMRFRQYESTTAHEVPVLCPNTRPSAHPWLEALAKKNELSCSANTHYLLHGTSRENLARISQTGLRVQLSQPSGLYGQGIYFTESSCTAQQYGDGTSVGGEGCILICRVALGNVFQLQRDCIGRNASPAGYHSLLAARKLTRAPRGSAFTYQLHNEYVVFSDCACYPEFVLEVNIG